MINVIELSDSQILSFLALLFLYPARYCMRRNFGKFFQHFRIMRNTYLFMTIFFFRDYYNIKNKMEIRLL